VGLASKPARSPRDILSSPDGRLHRRHVRLPGCSLTSCCVACRLLTTTLCSNGPSNLELQLPTSTPPHCPAFRRRDWNQRIWRRQRWPPWAGRARERQGATAAGGGGTTTAASRLDQLENGTLPQQPLSPLWKCSLKSVVSSLSELLKKRLLGAGS
jgi:hypothetical protein